MRTQPVQIQDSIGRILCNPVFRSSGKKIFSKGHVMSEDDIRVLTGEGLNKIWVSQLDAGEMPEDQAVTSVATGIACGSLEIRVTSGGRANLIATEDCCLLIDDDLLKQINCTAAVVVATGVNFSHVKTGQRVATVKSAPFAVSSSQLETVTSLLRDRGPLLQARPIRKPTIGAVYADACNGDRARGQFEHVMKQRLERFGASPDYTVNCRETEFAIARSIQHLLRAKPTAILIASTVTPAGPEDAVGLAMARAGCQIERFLAPVEPGSLFLLGYKDETPIISAPGCFRSAKPNVVDLVLPPILARYRVTGWEVACLGHGGLLA